MSDFSLMDAIECGIVKLPRVPVADNIPGGEMPKFRNLWEHIRHEDAEEGPRQSGKNSIRSAFPPSCRPRSTRSTATTRRPSSSGSEAGIRVPPVLHRRLQQHVDLEAGLRLHLRLPARERRRLDNARKRPPRAVPQLRRARQPARPAAHAPDRQRAARIRRGAGRQLPRHGRRRDRALPARDRRAHRRPASRPTTITDQDLLREVMNTVGKQGRLGERIRCVVSVSMLTEGWDANTVTHVLGVRAFGTQLLCEQVIGRALRRQSYDLNEEGLFNVEYADILGIPVRLHRQAGGRAAAAAARDDPGQGRAARARRAGNPFPARRRLSRRTARRAARPPSSTDDSVLELTPDWSAHRSRKNAGHHRRGRRPDRGAPGRHAPVDAAVPPRHGICSTPNGAIPAKNPSSICSASSSASPSNGSMAAISSARAAPIPAQLMYQEHRRHGLRAHHGRDHARTGRRAARSRRCSIPTTRPARPPTSTSPRRRQTAGRPIRAAATSTGSFCDSDWEAEFCRVAEAHPRVRAYVKNQNLGFEVPYRYGSETRSYLPDFIVLVDDGHGDDDLLQPGRRDQGLPRRGRQGQRRTRWTPIGCPA